MEEIEILDFGKSFEGVGKVNEKVCFVDFAISGEICECVLQEDNNFFYRYKLEKILKESPFRVVPKCKYFTVCGGCDIQHICKEMQLQLKKENIERNFKKQNLNAKIENVVSLNEYSYRNKMVFPVANKNGKTVVGMFKKSTHEIVEISRCEIADESINECLQNVKNYIEKYNIKGFNFEKNEGFLKYVVVRKFGEKLSIIFIVNNLKNVFKNLEELKVSQVFVNENTSNKEILSNDVKLLFGEEKLLNCECEVEYEINPISFMQVNNKIKEVIYSEVKNNISSKIVVDAYSGAGLLSAILSKSAKFVYGIEINKNATQDANKLIANNKIKNVKNYNGDCVKILPKIIKEINEIFSVVLDPPRSGVDSKLLLLLNKTKNCDEIIYISCNPETLVRDLKILKEFDIVFVKPYDMFPQTKHIETVVKLIKR